jgi:phosphate transport system ATP-binding protein
VTLEPPTSPAPYDPAPYDPGPYDPAPYDAESDLPRTTVGTLESDPSGSSHVLATHDLTLGFGSRTVLADVNLTFPRGTITALIGPTGSGKSTFLRTLNRMNDHVPGHRRSGDVTLDGHSIFNPRVGLMALRRRVGMLFQRPNPFPLSILENVVAGVRAHGMADKAGRLRIAEARLCEVGLWDAVSGRLGDSPFQLSGGQQQLLCLARALAIGPDVLLLDEPTSSLDPVTIEAVEDLMRRLVPALTLVVVTHNLAQARRVAHYTAFFNQGRLVEHARTAQIFENPHATETARYVSGRMG